MAALGDVCYFITLDASRGYLQAQIELAYVEKYAFPSHGGLYKFTRIPFDCSRASATLQRMIDCILGDTK